jgi:hypothetical protein
MKKKISSLSLAAALLAGCATMPTGPDVAVMPGPGKSFEQFKFDDRICRDHAERSLGTNPGQAGASSVAEGAGVGAGVGAAAGAALSGGRPGGIVGGAIWGLLLGSAVGANNAQPAERDAQRRYDIAYEQCMSAKGNRIPPPPVSYYRYRHYYPPPVVVYPAPDQPVYPVPPEQPASPSPSGPPTAPPSMP